MNRFDPRFDLKVNVGHCDLYFMVAHIIWARSCENVSYAICKQQRCRSACASAQSDSTFVVRCLDSTIRILAISKVSWCLVASSAGVSYYFGIW